MNITRILSAAVLAGLLVLPTASLAQGHGNGKSKSRHSQSDKNDRWRENGGHDNGKHKGWDKNGKRDDDRWERDRRDNDRWDRNDRRDDDWRRRDDDRRRREAEQRRREEEQRRREAEWRRRNDNRWDDNRWDNNRYDDNRYDDRWRNNESDRRQQTKNEWRNIGIASGIVGIIGLLNGDNTLTFAGAAGALYSAHRYEQDRKSQNRYDRARAHYFGYDHFYRDGVRYDRKTVNRDGQRYYQFVRGR